MTTPKAMTKPQTLSMFRTEAVTAAGRAPARAGRISGSLTAARGRQSESSTPAVSAARMCAA